MTEQHLLQNMQSSTSTYQDQQMQAIDVYSNQMLKHCVEHNIAVEYEDGVFLSDEYSMEADNLKTVISMIDSKAAHYRRERRKAVDRLTKIRRQRNIKDLVQRTVRNGILRMIPPAVLSSVLEQSAREDRTVQSMLNRVQHVCSNTNDKRLHFNMSDTDQVIFSDSDEESLVPNEKS